MALELGSQLLIDAEVCKMLQNNMYTFLFVIITQNSINKYKCPPHGYMQLNYTAAMNYQLIICKI